MGALARPKQRISESRAESELNIRSINTADAPRIEELQGRQGFDYELPDVRAMIAALGLEADGALRLAVVARPTVELYFFIDGEWRNPRWRFEALREIHEAMRRELRAKGFEDAHVWIPPEKKSFVRRLMKSFKWTRPVWTNLTRSTAAQG